MKTLPCPSYRDSWSTSPPTRTPAADVVEHVVVEEKEEDLVVQVQDEAPPAVFMFMCPVEDVVVLEPEVLHQLVEIEDEELRTTSSREDIFFFTTNKNRY